MVETRTAPFPLKSESAIMPNDVMLRREVIPTAKFYTDEEFTTAEAALPDYLAPVPAALPTIIHPTSFAELKLYEKQLQTFQVALERDSETMQRYINHRNAVGNSDQTVTYLQAELMKGSAYTLVHELFNHGPEVADMTHNVLWLNRDDYTPEQITIITLDVLRTMNKTPDDVVIVEKLAEARKSRGAFRPGVDPTVAQIRHFHFYTKD